MLRMGKLTDYATVVLASLAQEPALTLAAAELAERTRLSRPTVSKVLKDSVSQPCPALNRMRRRNRCKSRGENCQQTADRFSNRRSFIF